jgi:hypothetical protein
MSRRSMLVLSLLTSRLPQISGNGALVLGEQTI